MQIKTLIEATGKHSYDVTINKGGASKSFVHKTDTPPRHMNLISNNMKKIHGADAKIKLKHHASGDEYNESVVIKESEQEDTEYLLHKLKHKNMPSEEVTAAAKHKDKDVALAAVHHPNADERTLHNAVIHEDKDVALAALKHPKVTKVVTYDAARHPNKEVSDAAVHHPKADAHTKLITTRWK